MRNNGIEILYLCDALHGNSSFDSRYKFTAKELDNETNYTYFGARYYDSDLSSWLSVDPMSDKYPSLSPYAYCAGNPVILVDVDGRDILIWYKADNGQMKSYRYTGGNVSHPNSYVQKVSEAWNYNVINGGGDPSFNAATDNRITIHVVETDGDSFHLDGKVYWNPNLGLLTDNGNILSPATILDHEIDHSLQRALHIRKFNNDITPKSDAQYDTKEERRVITGSEQKTARANGEIKHGNSTRTNHRGKDVITNGVTSTIVNQSKTNNYKSFKIQNFYDSFTE
jgi:RHS repeat-associated protein